MRYWNLRRRHIGPIGLDIGHDSIKMLQLSGDGQRLSVHRMQKRRRPASNDELNERQDLILTIRQMLEEGDFQGRRAALCVSNDKLKVTSVRLSEPDVMKTAAHVYKEAAFRFGLDPGRDSIQYIPAGTVRQGDQIRQEVILFATDRQATEDGLAVLDALGLTAVGLEPVPCALARGFDRTLRRDEDRSETLIFLDVGSRFTTVVFSRRGEICFVKVVPVGMERFDQAIAAQLGVDPIEAETVRRNWHMEEAEDSIAGQSETSDAGLKGDDPLCPSSHQRKPLDVSVCHMLTDAVRGVADGLVREVSLCARYYAVTFRGHRIERLIASGGGAYEPILLAMLRTQIGVDVDRAKPFCDIGGCPGVWEDTSQEEACEWAVALGLSLKGWPVCQGPLSSQIPRRYLVPAS